MRGGRLGGLMSGLALALPILIASARLVAQPDALLVDGLRPSIDDTRRGERTPGNDLTRIFLPHHLRMVSQVKRLGWPAQWDPAGFGGRPAIGNPQAGLFYPPAWLAWWIAAPAALGWITLGHLLWGGLGTSRLMRALGTSRFAAVVAGACFEVSPYVLAQVFEGHYPHVWAAAWYPWAFWGAILLRREDARGLILLPPALAFCFLAGHPQEWYLLMLALGAWALTEIVRAAWSGKRREAIREAAVWAGALGLSLGLIAVELVPQAMVQEWGLRSERLSLKHASRYHLNPLNLLQLLCPQALGGPADYIGHDNYWETVLSLGWVPLVLAALAVAWSPRRGQVRGWALLAGLAVLFAAGHRLGLFAVLYAIVPGMDRFRVPARALFLASLAGSVLAGLGVETVARPAGGFLEDWGGWFQRYRRRVGVVLVGLVALQVLAWELDVHEGTFGAPVRGSARARPRANRQRELDRWLLAGRRAGRDPIFWATLLGTTAALGWVGRRPGDRGRVAAALGVLALIELGLYGHSHLQVAPINTFLGPDPVGDSINKFSQEIHEDPETYSGPLQIPGIGDCVWSEGTLQKALTPALSRGEREIESNPLSPWERVGVRAPDFRPTRGALPTASSQHQRDHRLHSPGPVRIRARDAFYDDLHAAAGGFEKTNVNDWFQIQHAADLYATLYPLFRSESSDPEQPLDRVVSRFRREVRQAVLDRMSVALLVTDRPLPDAPWPVATSGTWAESRFTIYRNPTALPRAYVIPRAWVASDDTSAVALFLQVPPREAVLMPADPLGPRLSPRQPFTPAEYDATDPDRVQVRVATGAPGLLVVADTWMPGWSAEVDGRPAPVLRGNRAQRVIPLPHPGPHRIVLRYRTPGLHLGLTLTAGSALVWGLLLLGRLAGFHPFGSRGRSTIVDLREAIRHHEGNVGDYAPVASGGHHRRGNAVSLD